MRRTLLGHWTVFIAYNVMFGYLNLSVGHNSLIDYKFNNMFNIYWVTLVCPGLCQALSYTLFNFGFTKILWDECYYTHYVNADSETWKGCGICSSHTDMRQHRCDLNKICWLVQYYFHNLYIFQISFNSIYVLFKIFCTDPRHILNLYCHHGCIFMNLENFQNWIPSSFSSSPILYSNNVWMVCLGYSKKFFISNIKIK